MMKANDNPVNPELLSSFHSRTDDLFAHKGIPLLTVSARRALRMSDWMVFAGAVYPVITRETKFRPGFLLETTGYNQLRSENYKPRPSSKGNHGVPKKA